MELAQDMREQSEAHRIARQTRVRRVANDLLSGLSCQVLQGPK